MEKVSRIRNFCIIAHIDHGKSTLADRFIERAQVVNERNIHSQMLDSMDIERERGITIKSQAVTLPYRAADGQQYTLNLVDTPGHVDFSYEVSRALAACEGALLLIDASQGVEAQTLANLYLALEHDLEIIPVINKIDLPSADIEAAREQIEHELGLDSEHALLVSAKNGLGIDELFEAIVERVPPAKIADDRPLKALIFDSHYDPYRGVVVHVRIFDGSLCSGDEVRFLAGGSDYRLEECGTFCMGMIKKNKLSSGDVGYIIAGIKRIGDIRIGDTLTLARDKEKVSALDGFRQVKPVVFSSIYPVISDDYEELAEAIERLKLNDASLTSEKDSSLSLGAGFRCGFLGLLHLEVTQERLEREFSMAVLLTAPTVSYQVVLKNGEKIVIDNPSHYPDPTRIEQVREPFIKASIITPTDYLGNIIALCLEKRGVQCGMHYIDKKRVELQYMMPLAEVLFDFYDRLKSVSRGYSSFDYDMADYQATDLVKIDILINAEPVDALAQLAHRSIAAARSRQICKKLREEIPRQQFKIPIQGAIGATIIARETISALRKDVTAKCYGGDISRKRKLLDKQRKGKQRMKMVGSVELPQKAFLAVLKSDGN